MIEHANTPGSAPGLTCPLPLAAGGDIVTLAHGEGGRLTRELIQRRIVPCFDNEQLRQLADAALLPPLAGRPVLSTDSFVVSPLFFPGGDIGALSVYGTVNDLAAAGARPRWLSLALIIEEGLPWRTLDAVLHSAATAARRAGVQIVTGDTKVVPRGAADGLFITTTGLGEALDPTPPGAAALCLGDALLVTGPLGQHGIAVLAAREELAFDPPPVSDCQPLWDVVETLRSAGLLVRAMRDATRGGVSAVLHEWAEACGLTMSIDEASLPVTDVVRGACELLGLDPIHVANEGLMVVALPADQATAALAALRALPGSTRAARIGMVVARSIAPVIVRRGPGPSLPLDEPLGALLPRIC
jgi:hydrogenase expression/formation protein HypE